MSIINLKESIVISENLDGEENFIELEEDIKMHAILFELKSYLKSKSSYKK